jgi:lysophospholipase L1-like esterase
VAVIVMAAIGVAVIAVAVAGWREIQFRYELSKGRSEDPLVWETEIRAFERLAKKPSTPENAIVFVGSSSIRFWTTLKEDMHPLPVVQHGFGGAKMLDVAHYARRLVKVKNPRAIVVYVGTNDIHPGNAKNPETLSNTYQRFVSEVRKDLPKVPIYYIAILPSFMRWEVWDIAQQTNALIAEYSANTHDVHFIDTNDAFLNEQGLPLKENYVSDGLHFSEQGYQTWSWSIRDRLLRELGP